MNTPAIEPRSNPTEAAIAFLALDGFGPEFVKDLSSYTEEFVDVFDGPGSEVRYSTGTSPTARFRAVDTGDGWIISAVELTCPTP